MLENSKQAKKHHIIVMGAGVVGITTAWYLRDAGYDVTVIDRQPSAGLETSKANGGQISVSHAEPWANPAAPTKVLKWLFNKNAPLRFYPALSAEQWRWNLRFLQECSSKNTQHNIQQLVALGIYSRTALQALRKKLKLEYYQATKGILHFYTDQKDFNAAIPAAEYMSKLGCERQVITAKQALAIEPGLSHINNLVGATYTQADESGNAYVFTQALLKHCQNAGVRFLFNTDIEKIHRKNGKITHLDISQAGTTYDIDADSYVLSLGSFSAVLAKQVGLNLLVYPAKGYSATYQVTDNDYIPETSLTDEAYKLVFSRYKSQGVNELRVAGMAEIFGKKQKYQRNIDVARAQLITQRVKQLFPHGLDFSAPNYWTGLRPTTPSNVPYIGRASVGNTQINNLFLNTGHGTLGWTHACGSAKALTQIISHNKPELDFQFL